MRLYLSPLTCWASNVGRHVLSPNRTLIYFFFLSPMTRFSLGFTESGLSPDLKAVYFSIYGLKGFSHRAVMMSVFLHDCC